MIQTFSVRRYVTFFDAFRLAFPALEYALAKVIKDLAAEYTSCTPFLRCYIRDANAKLTF